MYSLDYMKKVCAENDNHFFDKSTMEFFGSEVTDILDDGYFITCEDNFDRSQRLYTIRRFDEDAKGGELVSTVGEFQAYKTAQQAIDALEEMRYEL